MDTLPLDGRIAAIAREQHALIARRQLRAMKVTAKKVNGLVATRRLELVLPNVFRVTGAPITPEQPFAAAVLWSGPDSVASFRSAAAVWGIDVAEGARPETTVWGTAHPRHRDVIVRRVRCEPDRRLRNYIPVTSPERTIIDLAGVLGAQHLEIALESARHERLLTVESVRASLDDLGARGRGGSASLRALLATLADEPAAESALEVRVAQLLRASGLPKPQRQVEIVASGRRYRLDFAWPEYRFALECDGRKWHDFERDRRRWSAITAATGYHIVWATWARVREEPDRLIDEIRQRVSRRGGGRDARTVGSVDRSAG